MSIFEQQREEQYRRRHAEGMELNVEAKERQDEELEKKMAAKERVEKVAQEVKSTKRRMQNIMINIQQVVAAVRALRQQLRIAIDEDIPSVSRDKNTLAQLKLKLSQLVAQAGDLRHALKQEEAAQLRQVNPTLSQERLEDEAEKRVALVLSNLGLEVVE